MRRSRRLLSLVTMIFSIAPAVAPILGGWIVIWFDWRSIFLFLAFYTVILLAFCYWRLPETLPMEKRQPFNPRFLASSYGQILRSPLFHIKAGIVALNFAGLFLFITAAPETLPKQLHLGPSQFGWLFIPCVSGIFMGALCGQPHRRQGHVRAPDRHRLCLPAVRCQRQCHIPPVPAALVALVGAAPVLLHLRHVAGGAGRDPVGAGPVPAYPARSLRASRSPAPCSAPW